MQILKMLPPCNRELFCDLFEDLQGTINEANWHGMETELVNEMLLNHLGLEMECDDQLQMLFDYLMKHQGELRKQAKTVLMVMGE